METITWVHRRNVRRARIQAHVLPYVRVLGPKKAAELFLKRGGSMIFFPHGPSRKSALLEILDAEEIRRLGKETLYTGCHMKVPLANDFLVTFLRSEGASLRQIANIVRQDDATVRKKLARLGKPTGETV